MARSRWPGERKVRLARWWRFRSRQHRSMSFSSGAYFGSHSTVSQGRWASARVVSLLVWIGPLSRTATSGRALGGAGVHEQTPAEWIEGPEHRPLFRLAGGLDAQLGAAPRPAACQIGMRERLGFVDEHQDDYH